MNRIFTISLGIFCLCTKPLQSQVFNQPKGCVVDSNNNCISNANVTAVPFLRIVPDARGGGMGDAGIAVDPDANSMHFNAANLAFVEDDASIAATYTPWLRDLNLNDVYMSYLTGHKRINDLQTFGFGLRFFSLGTINFTDVSGISQGEGRPRELEFAAAYARKLGENFAASITGKYIFSNLASGQVVSGIEVNSASTFAADIAFQYKKEANLGGIDGRFAMGLSVTNLGAKVTYTGNQRDVIPSNLGLGFSYKFDFDDYNSLQIVLDANKLLVPTAIAPLIEYADGTTEPNPRYDPDGDGIPEYRQLSFFKGLTGSFSDAQGGAREEFQEINYSFGLEYWYDKQFAIRAGYYYEHPDKGARKFYTVGIGLKYNIFGINLSYLVPGSNVRSPLDNTLRFGLIFDLGDASSLDR